MTARFKLGSRVRTLVDAPCLLPGGFAAPVGTSGTVVGLPVGGGTSYGVLLDGDPDALSAAYEPAEIERAPQEESGP